MNAEINVSVIITTYNWPTALEKVISSLAQQTLKPKEIIIADDGSKPDTADLINSTKFKPLNLKHIWQEDHGFQAARIRNKAVASAQGDYLIFLDGDCIPLKNFIARHVKLAQSGAFVAGNRILLSEKLTCNILQNSIDIASWRISDWLKAKQNGDCNRLMPLLCLPFPRLIMARSWHNAKTCNLAVWKEDFIAVNGFDETYQGWGYEDSDLVIRLLKNGLKRKEGRFAVPVVHLWHPPQSRDNEKENWQRLQELLSNTNVRAVRGLHNT